MIIERKKQIKYYTEILKENEILLLKSTDEFFKCHYSSSPLTILTGFKGSEGEAIIDKNGKIKIFVDPRYHLLVDKQVYNDIEIYKMELNETFLDACKNCYNKNTILHVSNDILFKDYIKLDKYFDLRRYDLKESFNKNNDIKQEKIFKIQNFDEKPDFNDKIKKIKTAHPEISQMLIFNLDEISYLTNLRSYQMEFSSNFKSILYLNFISNDNILFCDNMPKNIEINNLKFIDLNKFDSYINSFENPLHIDVNEITLKNFLAIKKPRELKNSTVPLLASIKSASAIKTLQESFSNLDKALLNFKKRLKVGMSEYELSKLFEKELKKQGGKCLSFKTILAINENSASIHYSEPDKNKILQNENLILLDCGGYFESGFATDITRVFYFGKNPKPIYKKIYTNVLKAFLACYLSKETNAKKLDILARKALKPFEKEGFYFNHGLGHGIGTSVHQNPPRLSMNSKDTIKPFQVHSIEPGLYGKDTDGNEFGIRIENCVYSDINFKKNSLSKFPFEELLIDYSLLNKKEKEAIENWQESFNGNI